MASNSHSPSVADVAAFWDSRPCNIRHSKAPLGTRTYFDQVEARKYFVEPHIPGFALFPSWQGKRVLEIGCGIGTDATNFARSGAEYTGVELSIESLNLARRRFDVYGLQGTFLHGNVEKLREVVPPNQKFDLIYSFGVLHHTPDIKTGLREIRSFCHEETVLKMMVYARNSWKSIMIQHGFDQPEAQSGCPIANTYSELELDELLAKCDFRVVDIKQDHIFPYRVDAYREGAYEREPWFEAMPKDMFRALEQAFGWHMLVTAEPA